MKFSHPFFEIAFYLIFLAAGVDLLIDKEALGNIKTSDILLGSLILIFCVITIIFSLSELKKYKAMTSLKIGMAVLRVASCLLFFAAVIIRLIF